MNILFEASLLNCYFIQFKIDVSVTNNTDNSYYILDLFNLSP